MKKIILILAIAGVTLSALFIFPVFNAHADCEPGPLLPPCTCSGNCVLDDFLALAAKLAQYGLGLLSIITLAFVILGGFSFLTAMGNPEKIGSAKKLLGGTFRGMAIVLLAWVIVNTIIYVFTGNSSGLLFGGTGHPWWKFEETSIVQLNGDCPNYRVDPNQPPECEIYQSCQDTSTQAENWIRDAHCQSYGICAGGDDVICCDSGRREKCNGS
ncbi:MAG: hypothetical protein COT24_03725 [Candidatus Kerfeldbacteria bacterium CG08_land_8_20_14_0_20_40_16]|uniref:Uncharacterized protein n=1 Tax=Candidatus Kerfeldbacteria bacterium CG08_land_8_20_14_0_20_40_16 TaxID=2014244 RepID=A0A2H0YV90_9BACT|nr:MAG: hypothetical protein COT24_03725 [Candidatus Kerfeldbacteria bacterium CG08_land_8_20_14_0_20_40_16]